MPSLALDPALLAIPTVSANEEQIAGAIGTLTTIAEKLRSGSDCNFFLLSEASGYLAAADLFPVPFSISKMLADFNLTHVYTAEDIRRAVIDVLQRVNRLEELSSIEFMIPTSFTSSPDVVGSRTGSLREALELTLLHIAFSTRTRHASLAQALIADNLVRREISIIADVEDIDPALQPGHVTTMAQFKASVWSSSSVETFLAELAPEIIWQHAIGDAQLALAIKIAAREIRRVSGCSDPDRKCDRFSIGAHFFDSLKRWGASADGKLASSTLESCARVVARMPKSEINRFFRPSGQRNKTEDITRSSDRAEAWRTHVSKDHEAIRLMFWRKSDGSIEFANIGAKSELEIL